MRVEAGRLGRGMFRSEMMARLSMGVALVAPVEAQESEPPDPSELVEVFAAVDDVEGTEAGELVVVDVLSNDGDGDDPGAALEVVTAPGSGVAVAVLDEGEPIIAYTPAVGFGGVDSFSYRACVAGQCGEASVSVYVGTSACTIVGTNGPNTLTGTGGDDVICGRGGDDALGLAETC